jgi:mRNA-degrading endonuclease RelE of RelBE toxin-antitoxin system
VKFIIADTFLRSLERLDGESQKLVKQAAFEFQVNPAHPGFQFHKLERAKDKRFSSARVNRDLRIIIHRDGASSLMLCYADHHDAAYGWAERRMLDVHPTTGAIQLVEVEERVQEVVRTVVREQEAPIFARYEPDYLLALGVPPQWLDALRTVGETAFLELAVHLPSEVGERLLELAEGKPVPRPVAVTATAKLADAFEHPDSQRHFRVMESRDELAHALDAPWDRWLVFLHPDQQRYANSHYKGPARVYGGAGTGKTVVAVHRAVQLARAGRGRVLLTTFSKTLSNHLRRQVELLAGVDPFVLERLDVIHLHQLATSLWSEHAGRRFVRARKDTVEALLAQAARAHDEDVDFAREEFWAVIDAQGIVELEQYLDAARTGRGAALGVKRRRALWQVFSAVLERLQARRELTWNGVVSAATSLLDKHGSRYTHVVADEAQDFGAAELRLIRALAAPGVDDVFLCADEGQRIYRARFSWAKLGLDVRGRSHRLNINYRTTAQIRRQADRLLPRSLQDADGEALVRGAISQLTGPEPELRGHTKIEQEIAGLHEWLETCRAAGIPLHQVAIFARTQALLNDRALPALAKSSVKPIRLDEERPATEGETNLGTMHRAKGLEFRAVAVIACDTAHIPDPYGLSQLHDPADRKAYLEQERNLLYVACTRARERLLVSWVGKPAKGLMAADD